MKLTESPFDVVSLEERKSQKFPNKHVDTLPFGIGGLQTQVIDLPHDSLTLVEDEYKSFTGSQATEIRRYFLST